MPRLPLALAVCAVLTACVTRHPEPPLPRTVTADDEATALPRSVDYVANAGQWPDAVRYRARLRHGSVLLQDDGWTLVHSVEREGSAVHMSLHGAAPGSLRPEGEQAGRHNYLIGNDPSHWRANVPLYESVLYRQPYPHVDVRARSSDGAFEYDLLLDPEADLAAVQVAVEGASAVQLDGDGGLLIETAIGTLHQRPPVTWQTAADGTTRRLSSRCVLLGRDRFGFEVDGWDRRSQLTVDPGLLWSTFLGGNGGGPGWDDAVLAVYTDKNGIVTATGSTLSANFPVTPGAFRRTYSGGSDVFVTRFDPKRTGSSQLIYSTFLGGTANDSSSAIFASPGGLITVAGSTSSPDFPTTANAYAPTYEGGARDAFVARLDPESAGPNQLVYSTFLGSIGDDRLVGLAVDGEVITVAGYTDSTQFPTVDAYDTTYNGGRFDLFVSKLDLRLAGSAQLTYSTYLGSDDIDVAGDITVAPSGIVTIVGSTTSPTYPTTAGAFANTLRGPKDAIVSQLDPQLTGAAQLIYSTFLGGDAGDQANAAAVDGFGVITITGITADDSFPTTANAFDHTYNGGNWDAFITQLDPARTGSAQLLYSTLIGGSSDDFGLGVFVDSRGTVTIAGEVGGAVSNFPTTPGAYDIEFGGGGGDAYVARLDPTRSGSAQLIYSTFLGSNKYDRGIALAADPNGVTIGGVTGSKGFPVTPGAFQPQPGGGSFDGYVSRLDLLPRGVTAYGASSAGCTGPLVMSVNSMPVVGNSSFQLLCNDAPPNTASGIAIFSYAPLSPPVPIFGVDVWVSLSAPHEALAAASNARGASDVAFPIPASPLFAGKTIYAQFFWIGPSTPPPCPPMGWSASNALSITIQP